MNRYILRLVLFLIAASLILAGCGDGNGGDEDSSAALPSDPLEALKEINQAAQELKSTHFTMDVTMDVDAEGMSITMDMAVEGDMVMVGPSPDDVDMQMEMSMDMLGQQVAIEMIAVDGEYWMREAGGSWQKEPAAAAGMTTGLGGDPTAALQYLEQARDVKRLGDEKVEGTDCYRFSFTMDADALATPEMLGQVTSGGQVTDEQARQMLETAVLAGEVWVGKEDLFPRREVIDMKFEISGLPGLGDAAIKYDMQIDMRFSKLNQPVEIKTPAD